MIYDLAVIGGGPSGLTASIHACFEGLNVVLFEGGEIGGQSVTTSYIMNFPSYPQPISGHALIKRMTMQLESYKDQCTIINDRVVSLENRDDNTVGIEGLVHTAIAKKVLLCTGLKFKHDPIVPTMPEVFYGPAINQHPRMAHKDIAVIGGANSAGQAVLNLYNHSSHACIVTHHDTLDETMSSELVKMIKQAGIEVLTNCELEKAEYKSNMIQLAFKSPIGERYLHVNGLFICIGQTPDTSWIDVNKNEHGEIVIDSTYHTSMKNVFACGDTTANSIHRVIAVCGRASEAIACILKEVNK